MSSNLSCGFPFLVWGLSSSALNFSYYQFHRHIFLMISGFLPADLQAKWPLCLLGLLLLSVLLILRQQAWSLPTLFLPRNNQLICLGVGRRLSREKTLHVMSLIRELWYQLRCGVPATFLFDFGRLNLLWEVQNIHPVKRNWYVSAKNTHTHQKISQKTYQKLFDSDTVFNDPTSFSILDEHPPSIIPITSCKTHDK